MFWIGFAAGTAVAMLMAIASIAALVWNVSKERATTANLTDKYWLRSLEIQDRNAETFERIESLLTKKEQK